MQAEWFKDWFNSKYYFILYKNRDETEAAKFIDNLSSYLHLTPKDEIWDLACGKGRHAVYLSKKGCKVIGTDLSTNSILCASAETKAGLEFYVHDMRQPFRINYFDYVLNLFTSIGYFERSNDTLKVFRNVHHSLKPGGRFIIDFFNREFIIKNLENSIEKNIDGIKFKISKRVEANTIIKKIEVKDGEKQSVFEEKVCLYELSDFMDYASKVGFKIGKIFGDYQLNTYNPSSSERLIIEFIK